MTAGPPGVLAAQERRSFVSPDHDDAVIDGAVWDATMSKRRCRKPVLPDAVIVEDERGHAKEDVLENVDLIDVCRDLTGPPYRQPRAVPIGEMFGGEGAGRVAVHVRAITGQVWSVVSGHDDDGIAVAPQGRFYVPSHLLSCDKQTIGVLRGFIRETSPSELAVTR